MQSMHESFKFTFTIEYTGKEEYRNTSYYRIGRINHAYRSFPVSAFRPIISEDIWLEAGGDPAMRFRNE